MEKKLKNALWQFVIWSILLIFVFFYLQTNPAEKQSIISGPQILFENVKIIFYRVFTDLWDYANDKYSLERIYREIILTAESMSCFYDEMSELRQVYNSLQEASIQEYARNSFFYNNFASNFSRKINEWCED